MSVSITCCQEEWLLQRLFYILVLVLKHLLDLFRLFDQIKDLVSAQHRTDELQVSIDRARSAVCAAPH